MAERHRPKAAFGRIKLVKLSFHLHFWRTPAFGPGPGPFPILKRRPVFRQSLNLDPHPQYRRLPSSPFSPHTPSNLRPPINPEILKTRDFDNFENEPLVDFQNSLKTITNVPHPDPTTPAPWGIRVRYFGICKTGTLTALGRVMFLNLGF